MAKAAPHDREASSSTAPRPPRSNGHDLIAIAEWLPGKPPTRYEREVFGGIEYETRYWRCRNCAQERDRRAEFTEPCPVERRPTPVMDGGYSVDDARTRRALSKAMTVHFGVRGPVYRVDSESGKTYLVDVDAETCTCPDHRYRAVFCKHLRRVDLEVRTGTVLGPDGAVMR